MASGVNIPNFCVNGGLVSITSKVVTEELTESVAVGKLKAVKDMLRKTNVAVDAINSQGMTALGIAAQLGHLHIVNLLLMVSLS